MRFRAIVAALVLWPSLAVAQISPFPGSVTPPIVGLPAFNPSAPITPTSVGVPASTCAAPGIYLTTATTTGIAFTATPSVILCVNGVGVLTTTSTAVTSTVPYVASATTVRMTESGSPWSASVDEVWIGAYDVSGAGAGLLSRSTDYLLTNRDGSENFLSMRAGAAIGFGNSPGTASGKVALDDTLVFGWSDLSLSRLAADTLGLRRGAATQTLRVGPSTSYTEIRQGDGTNAYLGTSSQPLILFTGGTDRWQIGADGHLTTLGAYNIGDGAGNSPVNIYNEGSLVGASGSLINNNADGRYVLLNSALSIGVEVNFGTAAPTFNNGTVGANSRNTAGTMTLTGANVGGTVTFGSPAFTNTPHCIITGTQATDNPYITAISGSAFTVAGMTANGTFSYICIGGV